jgi:hypothetical protein
MVIGRTHDHLYDATGYSLPEETGAAEGRTWHASSSLVRTAGWVGQPSNPVISRRGPACRLVGRKSPSPSAGASPIVGS